MGQTTAATLELAGLIVHAVDTPAEVGSTVAAAAKLAFDSSVAVAVLLSQRLIGTKSFLK
jgi:sulfopyruvate decarboxylase TPP-binding subunit